MRVPAPYSLPFASPSTCRIFSSQAAFSAVDFKLSAQSVRRKKEGITPSYSYEKCIINELDCRIGGKGGTSSGGGDGGGRGSDSGSTP